MRDPEIGFENAKTGDRCYSPLFKSVNPDDKTNGRLSITGGTFCCVVTPDIGDGTHSFKIDGSYSSDLPGQVLFWENPIKEIPTRPKRKVVKKGFIGVMPVKKEVESTLIACATDVYETDVICLPNKYQLVEVTFAVEE